MCVNSSVAFLAIIWSVGRIWLRSSAQSSCYCAHVIGDLKRIHIARHRSKHLPQQELILRRSMNYRGVDYTFIVPLMRLLFFD